MHLTFASFKINDGSQAMAMAVAESLKITKIVKMVTAMWQWPTENDKISENCHGIKA